MIGERKRGRSALQLFAAPNCPSGKMDLLLMPDQMTLQIHVGKVIEDDRVKGAVKNPNYLGVSATFGRSLRMVGEGAGGRAAHTRISPSCFFWQARRSGPRYRDCAPPR